jgi:DNA-binding GntR family transcriptional regulator
LTKTYGYKNGDSVAGEVVRMLLDGRLRPGDRIDRNDLATRLGVSRAPVQEALIQLERDGLISTRYHQGAFVEQFDADAIRDHYSVWGLLNGEAVARAASKPEPALVAELDELLDRMRTCEDSETFDALGFEFRRQINSATVGPRLRATLRGFLSFMPETFRVMWPERMRVILPYYATVCEAIANGLPDEARRAEQEKSEAMAALVIEALEETGVFVRQVAIRRVRRPAISVSR